MNDHFADKVVPVTGASRGIGRAVALAFAREGAQLVLAARSAEHLTQVENEVRNLGSAAVSVPTDVTSRDAVAAMVNAATTRFGRIDVLVDNAGIGKVGGIDSTEFADGVQQTLGASLFGMIDVTQSVLPIFRRQGGGRDRQHVVSDGAKGVRTVRLVCDRDTRSLRVLGQPSPRSCRQQYPSFGDPSRPYRHRPIARRGGGRDASPFPAHDTAVCRRRRTSRGDRGPAREAACRVAANGQHAPARRGGVTSHRRPHHHCAHSAVHRQVAQDEPRKDLPPNDLEPMKVR